MISPFLNTGHISALLRMSGNDLDLIQLLKIFVKILAYFRDDSLKIFAGISLETAALLLGRLFITSITYCSLKNEKVKTSLVKL